MRMLRAFFRLLTLSVGCFLLVMGWGASQEPVQENLLLSGEVQFTYGNMTTAFYLLGAVLLASVLLPLLASVARRLKKACPAQPAKTNRPAASGPASGARYLPASQMHDPRGIGGGDLVQAAAKSGAPGEDVSLPPVPALNDMELDLETQLKMDQLVALRGSTKLARPKCPT